MKRTLAALTITALAFTGGVVALDAQRGQGNGNGNGAAQRRAVVGAQGPQRGPGFQMGPGFRRGGPGRPGGPGARLRGLNLTDEQKAQVKAIHEKLRQDIEAVLTPEQQAQLKARGGGRGGRGGRGGGTE